MNSLDKQYTDLLQDILDNGTRKMDRTGTGTISVFGRQIRHKMSEGFPLLTTKKMPFRLIVTELIWFLRGDTNIKFLVDNGCHIWDGDAYKNYLKWAGNNPLSMVEFVEKIKTDSDFADVYGELGPIYGKQWRKWVGESKRAKGSLSASITFGYIDQIQNLIEDLKENPDSRRLMVNAWNVGELDQMVLPPCHYGFQVYTRELSKGERMDYWFKNNKPNRDVCDSVDESSEEEQHKYFDDANVPKRAISLMWNQRSVDTPLGLPFNIASYGLLLEIIAKEVNMIPDELIGNLGDCHIYLNQIDGVKEQLKREPYELPSVEIVERNWYMHEKAKEHLGPKSFNDKIMSYRPDCFILKDYQSHDKIKIPLSN